jgi:DNA-binding winged helix-turn-helix (wHTH) protein
MTSHINAVRKAISDSGGEQRLIRTIARKDSASSAR